MSNMSNNEAPIIGAEGRSSEVGEDAWVYTPARRAGRFAKWRNPIGIAGAIIVGLNILIPLFGPYIWTIDPNELVALRLQAPSWAHPMGTDELGRDQLARIIHGSQLSLAYQQQYPPSGLLALDRSLAGLVNDLSNCRTSVDIVDLAPNSEVLPDFP